MYAALGRQLQKEGGATTLACAVRGGKAVRPAFAHAFRTAIAERARLFHAPANHPHSVPLLVLSTCTFVLPSKPVHSRF